MKTRLIFILFIICNFCLLNAEIQKFCSSGNECGMLKVQIFDEMEDPVSIKFSVYLTDFYTDSNLARYSMTTESDGTLSASLPIGKYYILFGPDDRNSNTYSFDPDPTLNPQASQVIEIRKNHITTIKKIVKPGGILKIVLLDKNNSKILLKQEFPPKSRVDCILYSSEVASLYFADQNSQDDFSDGELYVNCLFPSNYDVYFNFPNMGYGSQKYANIKVERNKITELMVVVDKKDNTGIQGQVIDSDGVPVEDAEVQVSTDSERMFILDYAETTSDANGNYRIIGLKEKEYNLSVYKNANGVALSADIIDIYIKSNSIIKKDIVLKSEQ